MSKFNIVGWGIIYPNEETCHFCGNGFLDEKGQETGGCYIEMDYGMTPVHRNCIPNEEIGVDRVAEVFLRVS